MVEFDPANKIIPFPNNLLLDPTTGKINLPAGCNESAASTATRTGTLNQLDGFGTFEGAMNVTFTEEVDVASLGLGDADPANDKVVLFQRKAAGVDIDPATATPIPLVAIPGTTTRLDLDCANPQTVNQVTFVPRIPLQERSTYVLALLEGITTVSGGTFEPSGTWGLVREPEPVVVFDASGNYVSDRTPLDPGTDLESLQGIDLLWKAHFNALTFVEATGSPRASVLLATDFNTMSITTALDPAVANSPAAKINAIAVPNLGLNTNTLTTKQAAVVNRLGPFAACVGGDNDTQCFLKVTLGKGVYAAGDAACASLGCAAVGDVLISILPSDQYTSETANPYTDPVAPATIPGQWDDPNSPTMVKSENIQVLVFVPAAGPPAAGYPTVLFQHGIGQSKTNAFAVASQLAAQGFATVSMDAVLHDSRAVRISNTADADPKKTCVDVATSTRPDKGPDPVAFARCYAPVLPGSLGAQRDALRQTLLDQQRLIVGLKACTGGTPCGLLDVDPARIVYLGHSLGGIVGGVTVALRSDIKAAVLDVPGVGIVDILENTGNKRIQCGLVDGLIAAGVVTGEASVDADSDGVPESGTCLTDEWKTQPGYRQFSVIYRWVINPGDPANYTSRLATKKILIQEVIDDGVVPNSATENMGALVGLTAATADPFTGTPTPSAAICTGAGCAAPTTNKFVQYPTLPAAGAFPGNTFDHGSLLTPAVTPGTMTVGNDGRLGTGRIQTDAFTFLVLNR